MSVAVLLPVHLIHMNFYTNQRMLKPIDLTVLPHPHLIFIKGFVSPLPNLH